MEERIDELSKPTGVPIPFDCFFAVKVENAESVEGKIHDGLKDFRLPNREFFKIAPERVVVISAVFKEVLNYEFYFGAFESVFS